MFKPVNSLFEKGNKYVPTHEEILNLVEYYRSEVENVKGITTIEKSIAVNIAKSVKMFAIKISKLTETGEKALQFSESSLNEEQSLNSKIFNALNQMQSEMESNFKFYSGWESILLKVSNILTSNSKKILLPFFEKMRSFVRDTIHLSLHQHKLSNKSSGIASQVIQNIQFSIANFHSLLKPYERCSVIYDAKKSLSQFLIFEWINSATLLRPYSEQLNLYLTAEMTQIELTVALLLPVKEVGPIYLELRSLRHFVKSNYFSFFH